MTATPRTLPHPVFLTVLLLSALWLPLPLYLVSLALFGLPHVIWEMGFIRSRYAARWPLRWWVALWMVLLMQAGMRGALWMGSVQATSSQIVDLLSLLLLALLVVLAPKGAGWRVRVAGLLMAGIVWWLLQQGDFLTALLLLAMAHNFTPLAMAWDLARDHPPARPLALAISGLFVLPLLVVASGWAAAMVPSIVEAQVPLLDGQLPQSWGGSYRSALLSAIVLAQCLHYYCVIYLLPRAEAQRTAKPVVSSAVRIYALAAVALMFGYYVLDYSAARKLYAVVAGAHAWLEWPVLLMAILSMTDQNRLAPTADELLKQPTNDIQYTSEMAYRLKAIPERGAKQYCNCCGQRNSIENLFYCLRCGEICCWQCIGNRIKKLDAADGKSHPACNCSDFLKRYDDWLKQA